jgi:hypothetical protein
LLVLGKVGESVDRFLFMHRFKLFEGSRF